MSKRPRGLFKAHLARGKVIEPIVTDLHIEHLEDPGEHQLSPSSKRKRLSAGELSPRPRSSVEDWEDIKELFSNAIGRYEAEQPEEAAELFRQVIHESDRLLRLYLDPILLLSDSKDAGSFSWTFQPDGPTPHAKTSSTSKDPIRVTDPLTTFHYIYGTSMLMLGKILEAYPSLAKDVEPVNSPTFYLAALDVLEDGENASHSVNSGKFPREDWRLAVSMGRTLVCLAEEKLRRLTQTSSTPLIKFQDELWPKDSAFGPSFSKRPPLTRRVALPPMTPHQILLQATDQFSRAILRMPHAKRNRGHRGPTSMENTMEMDLHVWPIDEVDAPPTMPGLGGPSRKLPIYIRPRVLYTIATDVLSIADRMQAPSERESWAKWADDIFLQMEMEEETNENWTHPISVGRGRCWLIIGSTRFEAIENLIERDGQALECDEAENARSALLKAVEYLERARATISASSLVIQDPLVDVPPMLGEAFVTLATLTPDGPAKEQFFSRAAAEGVNIDEIDEVMDEGE